MNYKSANEIKSCFDDVYCAPTPHAYFNEMHRLGYEIGQQAKEYFRSAALLLRDQLGPGREVRLLDLGCSYGVGAALLKYNFSFAELAGFFARHPARDYDACIEEMRELLATDGAEPVLECAGADASKEAIQFATDGGLIDAGIAKNLEANDLRPAAGRRKPPRRLDL